MAANGETTIRWLGHAAFEILTSGGKRILIDPWITGNPMCPVTRDEIGGPDLILLTHDHFDHLGEDLPYFTSCPGATIVAQPELVGKLKSGGIPQSSFIYGMGCNIGGTVAAGEIKVTMVQAMHSAGVGSPCGYIITAEDGARIYHAGDTGMFAGMKLLGDVYRPDVALLPIGSVFVMDPLQAAHAAAMLGAKIVIPMHYKTFPILVQDAAEFTRLAAEIAPGISVRELAPGEPLTVTSGR